MDKRLILALVTALGATAQTAWSHDPETGEVTIKEFNFKGLHPETVNVLARLRAASALNLVIHEGSPELRINTRNVPEDLAIRLKITPNAIYDEASGDFVLTDSLSAAIAASGQLNDSLAQSELGRISLDMLKDKVGDELADSIKAHADANLM